MRQLYIENEALLNLYIRPFTEGRMELNDELADEFLKQIRDASAQGYEDSLSMLELAEVLEQYFLKHGKRDNYIWTINLLGGIHNAMPDRQDGEKAAWYFQRFVLLRTVISRLKMMMSESGLYIRSIIMPL